MMMFGFEQVTALWPPPPRDGYLRKLQAAHQNTAMPTICAHCELPIDGTMLGMINPAGGYLYFHPACAAYA